MIGGIAAVDHAAVKAHFTNQPAIVTVAVVIMLVALFFCWLWLTEDVTALLNSQRPQTAINMGLPTNPIHILDLAFYLPAVLVTGVLLLLHKPLAYTVAPALTLFLLLTGVPILIIPVIQMLRGTPAEWGPVLPIGTLTVALLGLLIWLLSTLSPPHNSSSQ